jgi:tRNA pseudouridine55 synthase
MQVPPIFSAIKKGGKALYKEARAGKTAEDIEIEPREVQIYSINLIRDSDAKLPEFELAVECGGGTYIRSLIRDIGYKLDSVATTVVLNRTHQAQFSFEGALEKPDWTADNIYAAIERVNNMRQNEEG